MTESVGLLIVYLWGSGLVWIGNSKIPIKFYKSCFIHKLPLLPPKLSWAGGALSLLSFLPFPARPPLSTPVVVTVWSLRSKTAETLKFAAVSSPCSPAAAVTALVWCTGRGHCPTPSHCRPSSLKEIRLKHFRFTERANSLIITAF